MNLSAPPDYTPSQLLQRETITVADAVRQTPVPVRVIIPVKKTLATAPAKKMGLTSARVALVQLPNSARRQLVLLGIGKGGNQKELGRSKAFDLLETGKPPLAAVEHLKHLRKKAKALGLVEISKPLGIAWYDYQYSPRTDS